MGGRGKDAALLLRKVLTQRPDSAETNHCLGRALLAEGMNLREAVRALERAVELDSNRADYHLYVGWAANEAGNIEKADQALGRAIELDQGLADAYWQRGVLRARQGAVKDAILDFQKALELRPSRYEVHPAMADAYQELQLEAKALEHWAKAVQADPNNAIWQFRYGKLLVADGRLPLAREHLAKAIEVAEQMPTRPAWLFEAQHQMARANAGRPEAAKHWKEFLRLSPPDNVYREEANRELKRLGRHTGG
jgi:tetratricopeptide (TPR) repeat protein